MDLKNLNPKTLAKAAVGAWTFDFFLLANIALHYLGIVRFVG